MTERRTARRYNLSLAVVLWVPREKKSTSSTKGKSRDISTSGVYLTIEQDVSAGTELGITLKLPSEVTRGPEVFIRARGMVVRVDKKSENDLSRVGVAVVIVRYQIIRNELAIL
jgi:c-di-GMP-binding flagellar brake protein YcgR